MSVAQFAVVFHDGQLIDCEILDIFDLAGEILASVRALAGQPFVGGDKWAVYTNLAVVSAREIVGRLTPYQADPLASPAQVRVDQARHAAAEALKLYVNCVERKNSTHELTALADARWAQAQAEFTQVFYQEFAHQPAAAGTWITRVKVEVAK